MLIKVVIIFLFACFLSFLGTGECFADDFTVPASLKNDQAPDGQFGKTPFIGQDLIELLKVDLNANSADFKKNQRYDVKKILNGDLSGSSENSPISQKFFADNRNSILYLGPGYAVLGMRNGAGLKFYTFTFAIDGKFQIKDLQRIEGVEARELSSLDLAMAVDLASNKMGKRMFADISKQITDKFSYACDYVPNLVLSLKPHWEKTKAIFHKILDKVR